MFFLEKIHIYKNMVGSSAGPDKDDKNLPEFQPGKDTCTSLNEIPGLLLVPSFIQHCNL